MHVCTACEASFAGGAWTCPSCGFSPVFLEGIPAFAPELAAGHLADAAYLHEALATADEEHFWFVARHRLVTWALGRYFPEARTFCDFGCGSGGVLAAIHDSNPHLTLTAADALADALKRARQRVPVAEFFQLDLHHLPFAAEFDVVGLFDVIEHLDDDRATLEAVRSTIVPGGGLLMTVPQHRWLWSAVDEFSRHRRRYTRRQLVDTIVRAGFAVEYVTSFMALILPALFASRLRRRDPASLDPAAELRIGPITNTLFAALCVIEQQVRRDDPRQRADLAVARRTR